MKRLIAAATIASFAALAVTQNPLEQSYGLGPAGGSDALVSLNYTETSGSPRLEFRFTSSDTLVATMDGPGGLNLQSNPLTTSGTINAGSSIVFEGATADASETTVSVADPTADITYRFRDDGTDTYEVLTMPDADVTAGHFTMPAWASADANVAANVSDNELIVYRVFIPNYITVANIYARGDVITDSSTDDLLGVAIYEDADAGAQLATGTSADFTADANVTFDVTDVTLGPGFYRIAICSGDISAVAFVGETLDDEYIDVANLGAVTIGTAANSCTAAVPPTTTGALSTDDVNMAVLKLGG